MRIGINCDVAVGERPTGIGLHVRNLIDALAAIDQQNEYLLYVRQDLVSLRPKFPGLTPSGANFRIRPVRFPAQWMSNHPRLWWDYYLPAVLRHDRLDVFHGPNHFLPKFDPARSIVTIHDLAYFRMEIYPSGENAMLREWTSKALNRAERVIALSQNTRVDIEALGVAPERVRVIYGGGNVVPDHEIRLDRRDELWQKLKLPERYILFVGTILPRKNVPFLVRAFAQLKRMGLPHKLVLAGSRDTSSAEVDDLVSELGLNSDVLVTGYVEDWQLPLLYKGADLFVLPTLYEGFTLVTLEAMAYGTPVVATDTSSIREGVGEDALLVPVNDDEALASAMHQVITSKSLRDRLIAGGLRRAAMFTWERCATETLALYEEIFEKASERKALNPVTSGGLR